MPLNDPGRHRLESQPSSRTGENPPYGMIGGIEETSASYEARSAPRSYPTAAPAAGTDAAIYSCSHLTRKMSAFHAQAAGQGDVVQLDVLKGRTTMWTKQRASLLLAGAVVALVAITGERAYAQAEGPNSVKPGPCPPWPTAASRHGA